MKFKVVYVLCPINLVTGGTEALHQLVDGLITLGADARLVYFNSKQTGVSKSVPFKFKHYQIKLDTEILDQSTNALVIPETAPQFLKQYPSVKKYLWWLSADYCKEETIQTIKEVNAVSLYQSHYAKLRMVSNGLSEIYPLSDYSVVYPVKCADVRDKVALTTAKTDVRYRDLIDVISDNFNIIRLQKMSRIKLSKTLSSTYLFIDFGMHPGKDRLPREAARLGNVVFTSTNGSSKNDVDVPIPKDCKIEFDCDYQALIQKIKHINVNGSSSEMWQSYLNGIDKERLVFHNEIADTFGIRKTDKLPTIYTKSFMFWSLLEHVTFNWSTSKKMKTFLKRLIQN